MHECRSWLELDTNQPSWRLCIRSCGHPGVFLVKIGAGDLGANQPDHYLFANNASLDWAVVNLMDLGITDITAVGRISHVDEFNKTAVPEPSSMLLLGSGLAGLGLLGRKRINT